MAILVTYKQASINFERRWSSLGGLPLATNVALVENTAMANCRWREGGREGWREDGGREGRERGREGGREGGRKGYNKK